MPFSKELMSNEFGKVEVLEEAGKVSLVVTVKAALGGGQAAGIATAESQTKIALEGKQLIDLGFAFAAHKFPAAEALIKGAQAIVDEQIAKA